MNFRTSPQKSAWSCETNMFSAIDQATKHTMRAGGRSRSSSARPEGFLPSPFSQRRAITLLATKFFQRMPRAVVLVCAMVCAAALFVSPALAQIPVPAPPPPPGQNSGASKQGGASIKVNVNLVVLHTTVLDDRQRFADGLKVENFRVFEDKVEQKLSVFKREDLPVSMGLVIDNSGSMRDKRPRVNEAAITLVQASNPQDEAFVVNFNDDFYLDLDK